MSDEQDRWFVDDDNQTVRDESRNTVAHVAAWEDARLIASAPRLRDALRALVTEYGKRGGDDDALLHPDEQDALIREAMLALAESEGKEA